MTRVCTTCWLSVLLVACGTTPPSPDGNPQSTQPAATTNTAPPADANTLNPNVSTQSLPPEGNNLLPMVIHPANDANACLMAGPFNTLQLQPCAAVGTQLWSVNGGPLQNSNSCLQPAANGNNVVDILGTAVNLRTCTAGAANQQWTFANGLLSLAGGNVCLQMNPAGTGATMQKCSTSNTGQLWTMSANFTVSPNGYLDKCMTVQGGVAIMGALVGVNDCNQSFLQQWSYTGQGLTLAGLCVDLTSTVNGTQLSLGACTDANAAWSIQGGSLVLTGQGICVDLWNGDTTNGNKIAIYTCVPGDKNQVWVLGRP